MGFLNQLVQYGWETGQDTPKTDESAATVALDEGTALALAERLVCRGSVGRVRVGVHRTRRVTAAIRRHRPDLVIAVNHRDTYQVDHRAVGQATIDAVRATRPAGPPLLVPPERIHYG